MKGDYRDDYLRHSYLSEMATYGVSRCFHLTAKHIPFAQDCMADALARCRLDDVALTTLQVEGFAVRSIGRIKCEVSLHMSCMSACHSVWSVGLVLCHALASMPRWL